MRNVPSLIVTSGDQNKILLIIAALIPYLLCAVAVRVGKVGREGEMPPPPKWSCCPQTFGEIKKKWAFSCTKWSKPIRLRESWPLNVKWSKPRTFWGSLHYSSQCRSTTHMRRMLNWDTLHWQLHTPPVRDFNKIKMAAVCLHIFWSISRCKRTQKRKKARNWYRDIAQCQSVGLSPKMSGFFVFLFLILWLCKR